MRIGILGGTFDPVHKGHLALARAAVDALKLDRVIFVPAFSPLRIKKADTVASSEDRLEMIKLAIGKEVRFEVSDCEIKRGGISYTVDTLRTFRAEFPKPHELFFITGGDWGKSLDEWKDIHEIFSLAHFVVAKRPGFDTKNLPPQVEFLDFVPLDISSTGIRDRFRKNASLTDLVPKEVLGYIEKHHLYRS